MRFRWENVDACPFARNLCMSTTLHRCSCHVTCSCIARSNESLAPLLEGTVTPPAWSFVNRCAGGCDWAGLYMRGGAFGCRGVGVSGRRCVSCLSFVVSLPDVIFVFGSIPVHVAS